jgi:septation ring formation regulator EzrA
MSDKRILFTREEAMGFKEVNFSAVSDALNGVVNTLEQAYAEIDQLKGRLKQYEEESKKIPEICEDYYNISHRCKTVNKCPSICPKFAGIPMDKLPQKYGKYTPKKRAKEVAKLLKGMGIKIKGDK